MSVLRNHQLIGRRRTVAGVTEVRTEAGWVVDTHTEVAPAPVKTKDNQLKVIRNTKDVKVGAPKKKF